jgi:hypothetical protein
MKKTGGRFADARAARLARNGRTLLFVSAAPAVFTGAAIAGGGVTPLVGQLAVAVAGLGALAVACYALAVSAERAAETAWRVAELERRGVRVVVAREPSAAGITGQGAADLVRAAMARKADAVAARRLEDFERQEAEAARLTAFEREELLESLRSKRSADTSRDAPALGLSGSRPGRSDPRP